MIVLHYIFTLLIHFTTAQFPDHIDLQKVGEVTRKEQKYSILKPTVHKITDYFKEFMLRQETRKDKKIFIDNDGFRHFWTGVGLKSKNLRKTDINFYEINKNNVPAINNDEEDSDSSSEEGIMIPILRQGTAKTTAKPKATPAKAATTKPKATPAKAVATTAKPNATTAKSAAITTNPKAAAATTKPANKPGGGKKVAITSFFCPFLGVIKMTSILE